MLPDFWTGASPTLGIDGGAQLSMPAPPSFRVSGYPALQDDVEGSFCRPSHRRKPGSRHCLVQAKLVADVGHHAGKRCGNIANDLARKGLNLFHIRHFNSPYATCAMFVTSDGGVQT